MNLSDQLLVLKDNEPQIRLLIDMVQEFIVLKDGQGRWIVTNKQVLDAYELQGCDYQGKTDEDLIEFSPKYKEAFRYNLTTDQLAWEKGSALQVEKSLRGPDGQLQTWEVIKTPVFNDKGEPNHLIIVSRNITARKKAEAILQASEMKYRLIAENMKDIIVILDRMGNMQYLSPSFEHILGYLGKGFIGESIMKIVHPSDYALVRNSFKEMIIHKISRKNLEFRCQDVTGHYVWFEVNWSCVFKDNGEIDHVIAAAREITDRKKYETRLETMAYHDYLTNIPNRRFFMKELPKAMTEADLKDNQVAIVYLDLDHFKHINDTKGHDFGDDLLIHFVKRIQSNLRLTDMIARIGGDEFVILLTTLDSVDEAKLIVKRICDSLKEEWRINDYVFQTTSSFGVALYPGDGNTVHELISKADEALYKAKDSGRNQVHFHNGLDVS
ncbi:diguanylate cyclase domain-containing protein [Aquibacillus rhizosphaerae]|uniref:Diguanylate cyclase n=1 Tax=Aquibacillus rhizosphaerae TaxID=3051431 RepID=A0ABT7L7F5_9BACI|nr:diguanylate cyclase [Aquibacillus sp. LR5S19]MDL4841786.1 diguanylate cyclase [Aquibacillus sp. LR5S19]